MLQKGSFLYPVLSHKCPRCHEGDLFAQPKSYRFKGFFDMPDRCPKCDQSYLLEPGFYYGAMYVNYGVTIAICVAVFLAMYVSGVDWELYEYLVGMTLVLVLVAPYIFRSARALWLAMFVPYRPGGEQVDKTT